MTDAANDPRKPRWRARLRRLLIALAVLVAVFLIGFCINGAQAWDQPTAGTTAALPASPRRTQLRVLAYNLQKLDIFRDLPVRSAADVRDHLDRIAALIRTQEPDLVMLSEVVAECALCPVDQVRYLAQATGMHGWSFGEQYNIGLPALRIRGGNAILSRLPLRPVANEQLAGGKPFFWPVNNRRILWCEVQLNETWLRVASIHNDSFDLPTNARQVRQILTTLGDRPALLAGDFNAEPETESMTLFRTSGRFSGAFSGPKTYPAHAPTRRIDFVLAPGAWTLARETVIESTLSDHRPVLAVFDLPSR